MKRGGSGRGHRLSPDAQRLHDALSRLSSVELHAAGKLCPECFALEDDQHEDNGEPRATRSYACTSCGATWDREQYAARAARKLVERESGR